VKLVDSSAMARIDKRAVTEYAIPDLLLMENAGIKAYSRFRSEHPWIKPGDSRITFIAGKGNNGGDSLVMARQAHMDGFYVSVLLESENLGANTSLHAEIVRKLGIKTEVWSRLNDHLKRIDADVIFDGLFGTGIQGRIRDQSLELVHVINNSPGLKIAIDIPSGLNDGYQAGYPLVKADATLTLGLPKRCLYLADARRHCGSIYIVPIGFPSELIEDESIQAELLTHDDIPGLRPCLSPDAYKNSRGHLAVFAGCEGTTGAAILSSVASARSGAGLVSLFVEKSVYNPVAAQLISVMPKVWAADSDPAEFNFNAYSAFLAGPGWGFQNRLQWLKKLIAGGAPGVIDADAITLLSDLNGKVDLKGRWILTPHPGELARLSGLSKEQVLEDPYGTVIEMSERLNAVIVLKLHVTYICAPDGRLWIVDGMNPAMGTGGTGDVLAGIIAGLLAGGMSPESAASLGVLVHDRIGKIAAGKEGLFLSQDLLSYISAELSP
jgi:ADP-dependent NAD(P)H-hydrate dehydratase / NAD(P)H-hydrate epimerase